MSHGKLQICRICLNRLVHRSFSENESFCDNCLRQYIIYKLYDADILKICYPDCNVPIAEEKIRILLPYKDFVRYKKMKLLLNQRSRKRFCYCPKPKCKGFDFSLKSNRYVCIICEYPFCFVCKNEFIGSTCSKCLNRWRCGASCKFFIWSLLNNVKKCPRCKIPTVKNGGCVHKMQS